MPHVPPPPSYPPTPHDGTAARVRALTMLVLVPLWGFGALLAQALLEAQKGRTSGGVVLGLVGLLAAAVLGAAVLCMPATRDRKELRLRLAVWSMGTTVAALVAMVLIP
ncbi:hypothetical protein SSPIM334S_02418 [Streptomyces spiroverticillatus]